MKIKYKKLYLLTWNLGGNFHEVIRELYPEKSEFEKGYDYWDKTRDFGFANDETIKLNELNKVHDGCWEYITDNLKKAKLVYSGALITKNFFKSLIE